MADERLPNVASADDAPASLRPPDEWARVRLESVRDFLLHEGGRLMSLPDVSDPQKEIISANVDLLDIRIAELVEHSGSLEPSYRRLRLFKCIEDAIGGAFRIATKGESAKALKRATDEALEKHRAQTAPGRDRARKKVLSRREQMQPFVLAAVDLRPNAGVSEIVKLLLRKPKFVDKFLRKPKCVDRFKVTRRTIDADVAAIIENWQS
jgi:hypothetical protein